MAKFFLTPMPGIPILTEYYERKLVPIHLLQKAFCREYCWAEDPVQPAVRFWAKACHIYKIYPPSAL